MAESETFDALLKVVMVGDSAVGKTNLVLRYTQDMYRENFISTVGVDFKTKIVPVGSKRYKLQLWDTAGQERYNTIRKGFYRGAKGIVLVYDITTLESFKSLKRWVNDITENCGQGSDKPLLLFLANKVDLEMQRVVPMATGEEEAKKYGARFAEVSALSGDKVEEYCTTSPTRLLMKLITRPELHVDTQCTSSVLRSHSDYKSTIAGPSKLCIDAGFEQLNEAASSDENDEMDPDEELGSIVLNALDLGNYDLKDFNLLLPPGLTLSTIGHFAKAIVGADGKVINLCDHVVYTVDKRYSKQELFVAHFKPKLEPSVYMEPIVDAQQKPVFNSFD
ncbi:hypothetical protein EMCRGX_G030610 [Ephydatia muelleri]